MDLRGTQYHFVVGWRHIEMKNEDIESAGVHISRDTRTIRLYSGETMDKY